MPTAYSKYCCFFVIGLALCSELKAETIKRRTINALNAERTLATIKLQPRTIGRAWRDVAGVQVDRKYNVQRGDTLWGISNQKLRTPKFWPKLWSLNPEITNPHEINVGRSLNFEENLESLKSPEQKLPVIKLIPNQSGGVTDLDRGEFVNVTINNRFKPSLFVLDDNDEVFGQIGGAYIQRSFFIEDDLVFLKVDDLDTAEKGTRYAVVRKERVLRDENQSGSPVLGTIVNVVGEVEVWGKGNEVAKAIVTGAYDRLRRGDLLVSPLETVKWITNREPPTDMELRIILGEQAEFDLYYEGRLVLLDKGAEAGVERGFVFSAFNDRDLVDPENPYVEPESKAKIQVIYVSDLSSVGYVMNTIEQPVEVGDVLLPFQLFDEPPRDITRSTEVLEMN